MYKEKQGQYWDKRYKKGKVWGGGHSELAEITLEEMKKRSLRKILDTGCGYGRDCLFFSKQGFDVVGIDPSDLGIRIAKNWAKKEGLPVKFHKDTIEDTGLPSESFDVAYGYHTLHLIPEKERREQAVDKMAELLRPGGLAIQAVFSQEETSVRPGRDVHNFSREELEELFKDKFDIIRLERHHFPEEHDGSRHTHNDWLIIAGKKMPVKEFRGLELEE